MSDVTNPAKCQLLGANAHERKRERVHLAGRICLLLGIVGTLIGAVMTDGMYLLAVLVSLIPVVVMQGVYRRQCAKLMKRVSCGERSLRLLWLCVRWSIVALLAGGLFAGLAIMHANLAYTPTLWMGIVALVLGIPMGAVFMLPCGLCGAAMVCFITAGKLEPLPAHICASCGYDLTGLPNDVPCPECGALQQRFI